MTEQEAIYFLVNADYSDKWQGNECLTEANHMAIATLQKRIPQKPKPYKGWEGQCSCGVVFLDRLTNYCGNCGQALDWTE